MHFWFITSCELSKYSVISLFSFNFVYRLLCVFIGTVDDVLPIDYNRISRMSLLGDICPGKCDLGTLSRLFVWQKSAVLSQNSPELILYSNPFNVVYCVLFCCLVLYTFLLIFYCGELLLHFHLFACNRIRFHPPNPKASISLGH